MDDIPSITLPASTPALPIDHRQLVILFSSRNIYLFIYCVWLVHMPTTTHVELKGKSFLSFYHVSSQDRIQVFIFSSRLPYLLRHLTDSRHTIFFTAV